MEETTFYYRDELQKIEQRLAELRYEIARLIGYHDRDGSVPVATLEALLSGGRDV